MSTSALVSRFCYCTAVTDDLGLVKALVGHGLLGVFCVILMLVIRKLYRDLRELETRYIEKYSTMAQQQQEMLQRIIQMIEALGGRQRKVDRG